MLFIRHRIPILAIYRWHWEHIWHHHRQFIKVLIRIFYHKVRVLQYFFKNRGVFGILRFVQTERVFFNENCCFIEISFCKNYFFWIAGLFGGANFFPAGGCSDITIGLGMNVNALRHCRRRKARTVFSDPQLTGLEKRFEAQRWIFQIIFFWILFFFLGGIFS